MKLHITINFLTIIYDLFFIYKKFVHLISAKFFKLKKLNVAKWKIAINSKFFQNTIHVELIFQLIWNCDMFINIIELFKISWQRFIIVKFY